MMPIVNGLEEEFEGQIAFERHNAGTPEGRAVMEALSARGHPSYAIVDPDGDVLWTATGQLPADVLRQAITPYIDKRRPGGAGFLPWWGMGASQVAKDPPRLETSGTSAVR